MPTHIIQILLYILPIVALLYGHRGLGGLFSLLVFGLCTLIIDSMRVHVLILICVTNLVLDILIALVASCYLINAFGHEFGWIKKEASDEGGSGRRGSITSTNKDSARYQSGSSKGSGKA